MIRDPKLRPVPATHRDLIAWSEAITLAQLAYEATERFPRSELFGLALQTRRAAVSVASNIAEGAARKSSKEFGHFLSIALGSLAELDTQIEIAIRLKLLADSDPLTRQHLKIAQLTTRLRQAIGRRAAKRPPITDHGSPSTDHRSPITDHGSP